MSMLDEEGAIFKLGVNTGIRSVEKLLESELYKATKDDAVIESYIIADLLETIRQMQK